MDTPSPLTFSYFPGSSEEEKQQTRDLMNLYLQTPPSDLSQTQLNMLDPDHLKRQPPECARQNEGKPMPFWMAALLESNRNVDIGEWDVSEWAASIGPGGAYKKAGTSVEDDVGDSWGGDSGREIQGGNKVEDTSENNGTAEEGSSCATELELGARGHKKANDDFWAAMQCPFSWETGIGKGTKPGSIRTEEATASRQIHEQDEEEDGDLMVFDDEERDSSWVDRVRKEADEDLMVF
ncbi:hypothetical protein G7Y79_00029g063910 [Physcia stellaris]|nr:hypothetical protein G7Y79_00029g063910 [Physcia stellaris]